MKKTKLDIKYFMDSLDTFLYAIKCGYNVTEKTSELAAAYGNLDILKWLAEKNYLFHSSRVCKSAIVGVGKPSTNKIIEKKQIEILEWLEVEECLVYEKTCAVAALHGRFEILKWLYARHYPYDTKACENAAASGHFKCLKWLTRTYRLKNDTGCPWDAFSCHYAAREGHFKMLKWLTCTFHSLNGNVGCPWNKRTSSYTASYGQYEILEWLHAEGCPLDDLARNYLAEKNKT